MKQELELVIEYKSKINGLKYVRFCGNEEPEPKGVNLYCSDDDSGASDIRYLPMEKLNNDYIETNRYYREA